jgi:hypothetical protein
MNVNDLAAKFVAKTHAAAVEKDRQKIVSVDNKEKYSDDAEYCKKAMTDIVMPFLQELKTALPENQFSLAPQVDIRDHAIVGVSFKIGDGAPTTISAAFGNVTVTRSGDSGSSKGINFVFPPDAEPYISNSGDLTREKIAKLVEMVIDND